MESTGFQMFNHLWFPHLASTLDSFGAFADGCGRRKEYSGLLETEVEGVILGSAIAMSVDNHLSDTPKRHQEQK